jgi:branched-chain amino acid transport system substrate-binding protein
MLGTGCAVIANDEEREVVLVGVDLELSGAGQPLGEVFLRGLELRVDQINQQGLLGDRELKLQVEDNRSDPGTGEANLRAFAADPAVNVIITGSMDEAVLRVVENLNQQGVPTISLAGADEVVQPVEDRQYIFKMGPNAADNATMLTRELVATDVTTVGLITTSDRYGEDGREEMANALQDADLEVVVSPQVAPTVDQESAQAAAAEIVAYQPPPDPNQALQPDQGPEPTGPDAVVVWAPGPVAQELALSLDDQGYEGDLLFDAVAADEPFLSGTSSELLEGSRMIFTETLVIGEVIATSPAKAARQAWYRDYTARNGVYQAYSSFAADAVQIVVAAVAQADSTSRDQVRDAIEGARLDGLTGPIRMSPQNHSGLRSQALVPLVVSGDRWRLSG